MINKSFFKDNNRYHQMLNFLINFFCSFGFNWFCFLVELSSFLSFFFLTNLVTFFLENEKQYKNNDQNM